MPNQVTLHPQGEHTYAAEGLLPDGGVLQLVVTPEALANRRARYSLADDWAALVHVVWEHAQRIRGWSSGQVTVALDETPGWTPPPAPPSPPDPEVLQALADLEQITTDPTFQLATRQSFARLMGLRLGVPVAVPEE